MSSGSMFNDVIEWFLSRVGDRRQYKRRSGAFHMWWQAGQNVTKPGVGMEVSPNGLVFILEEQIPQPDFNIVVNLRNQRFPVRVKAVRTDKVDYRGKPWYRYMCEFTGIGADHWDLIVRYVSETPEPVDRRKMQNQEPSDRVDDAYRLLPSVIQSKIVNILVAQRKLDAPKPGQEPLLKLFYGGLQKQGNGPPMHRFNVHSRVVVDGDTMAYDTRFLISENGEIKIQ